MSAPLFTCERSAQERLVVRWTDHPVARLRGIEIAIEHRGSGAWIRSYYVVVRPGEVFDLERLFIDAAKVLENGGPQ